MLVAEPISTGLNEVPEHAVLVGLGGCVLKVDPEWDAGVVQVPMPAEITYAVKRHHGHHAHQLMPKPVDSMTGEPAALARIAVIASREVRRDRRTFGSGLKMI